ncbi:MAG: hypothetical protein WC747_03755 [Candidatus Babeliales bacterium]|jgi:hypothetical protein
MNKVKIYIAISMLIGCFATMSAQDEPSDAVKATLSTMRATATIDGVLPSVAIPQASVGPASSAAGGALSLGGVVISNNGTTATITNNGSPYSSTAILISGSTVTFNSPVIATSLSLTSSANIIINGDLVVNGSVSVEVDTTLTVRGDAFFNGVSLSMNYVSVHGGLFVSGDVFIQEYQHFIEILGTVQASNLLIQHCGSISNIESIYLFGTITVLDSLLIMDNSSIYEGAVILYVSLSAITCSRMLVQACKSFFGNAIVIWENSSINASLITFDSNYSGTGAAIVINPSNSITADTVEFLYNQGGSVNYAISNSGTINTDIIKLAQDCTSSKIEAFDNEGTLVRKAGVGVPYIKYLFNDSGTCVNAGYAATSGFSFT